MAKVLKKAKASSKSDNGPLFNVTVYTEGSRSLKQPVILERRPGGILVSAGRHGSSKRDVRFIPSRDVLYAAGAIGSDDAEVRVLTVFKDFSIDGHLVSSDDNNLVFKDEDGATHTIATNNPSQRVEVIAEVSDAPKPKKAKAKDSAKDKTSKKVKAKDGDGDEKSAKSKKLKVKTKKAKG